MEWAMMYSGRPSSSRLCREVESPTTVAEREKKQAEDYVNSHSEVPLEELAKQNKELQRLKIIEYHELKSRKCPTLAEQERGPDGRIIFSEEYIGFIFYRDLQPLVDLRVLKYTEQIIQEKITARDENLKKETEKNKPASFEKKKQTKKEKSIKKPSASSTKSG